MGAGLYRTGFMNGAMRTRTYRLTAASVVVAALGDFSREVAFIGQAPNTLGMIPASLGYMNLIVLWDKAGDSWLKRRLLAAGRMALTNYLSQTVLGVLALTVLLGDVAVNRTGFLPSVWRFGSCSYGGRVHGWTVSDSARPSGCGAWPLTGRASCCAGADVTDDGQAIAGNGSCVAVGTG